MNIAQLTTIALLAAFCCTAWVMPDAHAAPHGPRHAPSTQTRRETAPEEALARARHFSVEELRERLSQFYMFFVNSLEGATASAALGEHNVERRERLTLIKIRATRACRNAVFQNDALAGYVDALALCVQMKSLASGPEAAASLGADAAEFATASGKLEAELLQLGRHFLEPAAVDALHARLKDFAKEHPIGTARSIVPPSVSFDDNLPELGWLLDLPLAPFRALQGVDNTARAVADFNVVADGFSRTIAHLPLELAWESQLLVLQARREAETAGRALIDHAAWRAGQLFAAALVAALLFRLLTARLSRRQP